MNLYEKFLIVYAITLAVVELIFLFILWVSRIFDIKDRLGLSIYKRKKIEKRHITRVIATSKFQTI